MLTVQRYDNCNPGFTARRLYDCWVADGADGRRRHPAGARGVFDSTGEFFAAAGRSALSIRFSLPLVFASLLLAVVFVYSWATYRELSRSASDAAIDRLRRTTEQLALTSEASAQRSRRALRESAMVPDLADFLREPSATSQAAALEQLRAIRATRLTTTQWVRVELRAQDERIVLADGPDLPAAVPATRPGSRCESSATPSTRVQSSRPAKRSMPRTSRRSSTAASSGDKSSSGRASA